MENYGGISRNEQFFSSTKESPFASCHALDCRQSSVHKRNRRAIMRVCRCHHPSKGSIVPLIIDGLLPSTIILLTRHKRQIAVLNCGTLRHSLSEFRDAVARNKPNVLRQKLSCCIIESKVNYFWLFLFQAIVKYLLQLMEILLFYCQWAINLISKLHYPTIIDDTA